MVKSWFLRAGFLGANSFLIFAIYFLGGERYWSDSLPVGCGCVCFDGSIRLLRRLLSILLLAVLGLPVVSPLFAQSTTEGVRLPACCRRDGKHHCMGGMADRGNLTRGEIFTAPVEKCPYCPFGVFVTHDQLFALPAEDAVFASLVSHPSGVVQTESRRRIPRDRSRQKRGPPALSRA